jgi:hypothetical protein
VDREEMSLVGGLKECLQHTLQTCSTTSLDCDHQNQQAQLVPSYGHKATFHRPVHLVWLCLAPEGQDV